LTNLNPSEVSQNSESSFICILNLETVSTAPFDSNQFDAHYVSEVGNDAKTNFYANKLAFELIKPMILQQDIKPYMANKW
jgi:hypothetical protein